MIVVAIIGIVAAIAVPMTANTIAGFRLSGNARGAANAVALAKMRASSIFTTVRVRVDLSARTYQLERKTAGAWTIDGGTSALSQNVSFGFAPVASSPAFTQGPISEAPVCKDDAGVDISGTACVIFNSRGVPITSAGSPTALDAIYITDGMAVYTITVSATGMIRTWRTLATATPTWVLQ
jgi:Tfp pilus assembly protein FimT